jgi:low temperature requirement protein LtrA
MEAAPLDARVAPIELFFDLVFVFALTQVTALMADDLSGRGIIRGGLILGLLWWSWWVTPGCATWSRPTKELSDQRF